MVQRLHAGADDRERRGVLACEQPRRKSRDGRSADRGDRSGVEEGPQLPGRAVGDENEALVRVEPTGRVGGNEAQHLHPENRGGARVVGGHPGHQAVRIRRREDRAQRLRHLALFQGRERPGDDLDALGHRQQLGDLVFLEDEK